jgi:hypothetical protein
MEVAQEDHNLPAEWQVIPHTPTAHFMNTCQYGFVDHRGLIPYDEHGLSNELCS